MKRIGRSQGFTLVELLVVMAISGLLLTAIIQLFNKSLATYTAQEDVAAMQQNIRTAKMLLERDIRMAGAGILNLQGPNEAELLPLYFENNNGASGSDRLTVIYENPDADDCGTLTGSATILCNELPTLTLAGNMPASATTAEISEELDDDPYSDWADKDCSCNGTVYSPGSNMPFIVTPLDKSQSAILLATQVSNNGSGSNDNLGNGPNISYGQMPAPGRDDLYHVLDLDTSVPLSNKQLNTFSAGSRIKFFNPAKMYRVEYFIATDANGIMGLYRDLGTAGGPEVIAEHIEDFQCSFTLADGSVIDHRNLTSAEIKDVRLVQFHVIGRSARQHRNAYGKYVGKRMAIADHAEGPTDNYRRRLVTATVKIRNFGL